MVDSYVIDNGGEGKEVPVPKREDAFRAILGNAKANSSEEKVKSEPQPTLIAGDKTAKEYKDSFAGKEEAVVSAPEKEVIYGHCNNCRLELTEDKVVKTPIDYLKAEDGTMTRFASRFSVFCKQCMKFITLIDKDAQKLLNEMIHKNIR